MVVSDATSSGGKYARYTTSSGGEYVRYTSQGTATKQGVVVPEGGATGITVLAKAKPSGSVWPELEVFTPSRGPSLRARTRWA
jgi:hypothetical protein